MESNALARKRDSRGIGLDCRIIVPGLAAMLEEALESERIL